MPRVYKPILSTLFYRLLYSPVHPISVLKPRIGRPGRASSVPPTHKNTSVESFSNPTPAQSHFVRAHSVFRENIRRHASPGSDHAVVVPPLLALLPPRLTHVDRATIDRPLTAVFMLASTRGTFILMKIKSLERSCRHGNGHWSSSKHSTHCLRIRPTSPALGRRMPWLL